MSAAAPAAGRAAAKSAASRSRPRLSRSAALASALSAEDAARASAPPSVLSIPDSVRYGPTELRTPLTPPPTDVRRTRTAGAAVRQVGSVRRVFLLDPHLTSEETNGLAYRVEMMGRNGSISGVLIGSCDDDDAATLALPTSVLDLDRKGGTNALDVGQWGPGYGKAWHVAGGYDPREVYESGAADDPAALGELLDGVRDLAFACRGGRRGADPATGENLGLKSKVPVICVPHGLVTDGGSAFLLSSYVLATYDTAFRLVHPSRGLTLDPAGLSFALPRSGWEYDQPSAEYSESCAALVGLCKYEANAADLVELGLATHMMGEASKLGLLERCLSQLDGYDRQELIPRRRLSMDEREDLKERFLEEPVEDVNAKFRNRAVANLMHGICVYDAAGSELAIGRPSDEAAYRADEDPSLIPEVSFFGRRESRLVDLAATFDPILTSTSTSDVLEGLRDVANSQGGSSDPEERECAEAAAELASGMEGQSPLAVRVTHRLLRLGSRRGETLESCMEREGRAQRNMYATEDFRNWAKAMGSGRLGDEEEYRGWKHRGVAEVTDDEVREILEE